MMKAYMVYANNIPVFRFNADFTNASAPIFLDGEATVFKTANMSHNEYVTAVMLSDWVNSQSGEQLLAEDDYIEILED